MTAQYSLNKNTTIEFIKKYSIDLLLIDKNAFTVEYLVNNPWLQQFQPETEQAISILKEEEKPFLSQNSDRCTIFQDLSHILLNTNCLLQK